MLSARAVPRAENPGGTQEEEEEADSGDEARLIKSTVGETESTNAECLDGFFHKWDEIPRLQLTGCLSEQDSTLSLAPEVSELQLKSNYTQSN